MNQKPFGTFSKALPGSLAINFAQSSSDWCDDACPLKGTVCYATRLERIRPSVRTHLARKQEDLVGTLLDYTSLEAQRKLASPSLPWVRISTFGALPPPEVAAEHREAFREFFQSLPATITHLPVESLSKARFYSGLSPVAPRLSLASRDPFAPATQDLIGQARANGIGSFSVMSPYPSRERGWTRQSVANAFVLARKLRAHSDSPFQGQRVKVCPAVAGTAKCGACQLCADPAHNPKAADLVIYPEHP